MGFLNNTDVCKKICVAFFVFTVAVSVSFAQPPGGDRDQEDEELRRFLDDIPEINVNETPVAVPIPPEGTLLRFHTEEGGIYRIKTFGLSETPVDTVLNLVLPDDPPEFIAGNDDIRYDDLTSEINRDLDEEEEYVIVLRTFEEEGTVQPTRIQVTGPLFRDVFPNGEVIEFYDFSPDNFRNSEWNELPGGFGGASNGRVAIRDFPEDTFPNSDDNRGLAIEVGQGDVAFVFAREPIESEGRPIILRIRYRASNAQASLFLAALKGNLATSVGLDGSVTINQENSLTDAVDRSRVLELIYRQPPGTFITPLIQVAGNAQRPGNTIIFIDHAVIYELDSNGIF